MKYKFFSIIVVLFLISFVSADFQLGIPENNITKIYSPGEFVKGWINISFNNEDLNAIFRTSEGETISLINLLNLNGFYEKCEIPNCQMDYITSNPSSTKVINLLEGEPKIIGFKFNKNIISFNDVNFRITSDAPASCYNQLSLDVFNDNSIDVKNKKPLQSSCAISKTDGCFEDSKVTEAPIIISSLPLCQKVELPESIGFRIGANILSEAVDKKSINMVLYKLDGTILGSCSNDSVLGNGEFYCDVNGITSNETKEYYICVNGNVVDNLKINYYQDNENGCGFSGVPPKSENYSYNLIAYSKQFDSFGNINIKDVYEGSFLIDIQNYLTSKYGSLDCSVKNCIIPIKISPKIGQQITFDNLDGTVNIDAGTTTISNNFYDLSETPLKYSSDFKKIYLNNASFNFKEGDFWLKLYDLEIFSSKFSINKVNSISFLNPLITAATVATKFNVNVNLVNNVNITNYRWDFGNGDVLNTNEDKITYTYNSTGNFNLNITIKDSKNVSVSRLFEIKVETPIKALDLTLKQKIASLNNIKSQLDEFSDFTKNSIQTKLNLIESENSLTKIKINFDSAVSGVADSFYIALMEQLLEVVIPNSIEVSKTSEMLSFYFDENKINLDALALLEGNYSYSLKDKYDEAILSWNLNNLINTLNYKEISANYGEGSEILINVFELNIKKNNDVDEIPYLVIKKMDAIQFEKNYNKREIGDYIFIPLEEVNSKIIFSTQEDISFSDLPIFISPTLNKLGVKEASSEEDKLPTWIFLGLIIFLLILVFVIAYIVLQKWYSKKYEDYLFKNKTDLYNLIAYIESSKSNGVENDKIISNLRKAGWSSEQMRYIIRKYLGKGTGMLEIPIEKLLNFFKKKFSKKSDVPVKSFSKNSQNFQNKFSLRGFKK